MRRRTAAALGAVLLAGAATGLTGAPAAATTGEPGCQPGVTRYSDRPSYPLARLGIGRVRSLATGKGVTVAVVDSGVEDDNAHLGRAVLPGISLVAEGGDTTGRRDVWAHGTAVAGIIAARPYQDSTVVGMAPDAKILPVRVFAVEGEDKPAELQPTTARMAQGIAYAAQRGADVINVSMSTSTRDPALVRAVRRAVRSGAVVVASSGNLQEGEPASGLRYPAALPGVIGVAAADQVDLVGGSVLGEHVDVHAPGSGVLTTYLGNGDCLIGGQPYSSYAAAYVSGLAALLVERFPDESAGQIAYRILASADRPRRDRRDPVEGWGMISPYEALTLSLDDARPGPPLPGAGARATASVGQAGPRIAEPVDALAPVRTSLLWWCLLGGGLAGTALLMRPWWLSRRARSTAPPA